jgi:hypothetical protein
MALTEHQLTRRSSGRPRCALCHVDLEAGEHLDLCPGCGVARHRACAAELGTRFCETLGCRESAPRGSHVTYRPRRAAERPFFLRSHVLLASALGAAALIVRQDPSMRSYGTWLGVASGLLFAASVWLTIAGEPAP